MNSWGKHLSGIGIIFIVFFAIYMLKSNIMLASIKMQWIIFPINVEKPAG